MWTRWMVIVLAVTTLACSGGGDENEQAADDGAVARSDGPRFCDAYLEYLAEPTAAELSDLAATVDGTLRALIESVGSNSGADIDPELDSAARDRCQPEWTAGAQGAGNTAAAAEAFRAAVEAGDRLGARNIAAANAIAVFEPWESTGDDAVLGAVDARSFVLNVGARAPVRCEVETGVVLSCRPQ